MANGAIGGYVVVPVAVQTGSHFKGLALFGLYNGHAGHVAMAYRAGLLYRQRLVGTISIDQPPRNRRIWVCKETNMRLVDKPDVVGQPVDPFPIYGLV